MQTIRLLVAALLLFVITPAAGQDMPGIDDQVTSKGLREALISEAVLIVYGTGADEAVTAELKKFAEQLKAGIEGQMADEGWPITIRSDSDVSLPELGGCALFLVGTPASNVILTLYEGSFPVMIDGGSVTVGKERVEGADVATTFAMINPFNPGHYAVIYTGVNDAAIWNAPRFAFDDIGYVVVNGAGVQARGQFDTTIPEYWTALPGASVQDVATQLTEDTEALGIDFQPAEPLPGLADHSVFLLGNGPHRGTADLQAFLLPYLLHLHQNRGVRVVGLEAPTWMSSYLEAYVVDGTFPPETLQVPEETLAFLTELRAYNKGLAADQRIHVATFDLNHDVFDGDESLLPLKTWIGQLRDRATRKELGEVLAEVGQAYEGGNPAAMLQAVNQLNNAVALAALKKELPAEIYPVLRHYLDTEKTSIFYHQPETRGRRDTPAVLEARARVLRQNMTDIIVRARDEHDSSVLFFLHADHCNKGAPGPAYGQIPIAQYFDKYYEPTWEQVHSVVAFAWSGGYYDAEAGSLEVMEQTFTPDEFEAQVADFRKPNSIIWVDFSGDFWAEARMPLHDTWTRAADLYDGMVFFFDVEPATGRTVPIAP